MVSEYSLLDLAAPIAIKASAGTGKTYTLVRLVILLIVKQNVPLSKLLLVTFTRKATKELRHRLKELLHTLITQSDALTAFMTESHLDGTIPSLDEITMRLKTAYAELEEANIFTIHGFASYVIKAYPFESQKSFSFAINTDSELPELAVRDFFRHYESVIDRRTQTGFRAYHPVGTPFEYLISGSPQEFNAQKSLVAWLKQGLDPAALLPDAITREKIWQQDEQFLSREGELYQVFHLLRTAYRHCDPAFFTHLNNELASTARSKKMSWQPFLNRLAVATGLFDLVELWLELEIPAFIKNWQKALSTPSKRGKLTDAQLSCVQEVLELNDLLNPLLVANDKENALYIAVMKADFFATFLTHCQDFMGKQQEITGEVNYNALIEALHQALTTEATKTALINALRAAYTTVLIDEFQDTDAMQWEIFQAIFAGSPRHTYILIGDEKQSIYGWRGADLTVYHKAIATIPVHNVCELSTNYRSRPAVVTAINAQFNATFAHTFTPSHTPDPNPIAWLSDCTATAEPGIIFLTPTDNGMPYGNQIEIQQAAVQAVAHKIATLLHKKTMLTQPDGTLRPLTAADIACLLQANRQAEPLQQALQTLGVPAICLQSKSILQTPEARVIFHLLQALGEQYGNSAAKTLFIGAAFSHGYGALSSLPHEEAYQRYLSHLQEWQTLISHGKVSLMLDEFLEISGYPISLLTQPDGERAFVTLRQLCDLLLDLTREGHKGITTLTRAYQRLLLKSAVSDPGEEDIQTAQKLEHDKEAVQILTAHAAKGLEYPVVFSLIGLGALTPPNSGLVLPCRSPLTHRQGLDFLSSTTTRCTTLIERNEEFKRLFYVTLTRAKSRLYLLFIPTKKLNHFSDRLAELLAAHQLLDHAPDPEGYPSHLNASYSSYELWQKLKQFTAIEQPLFTLETSHPLEVDAPLPVPLAEKPLISLSLADPLYPQVTDRLSYINSYTSLSKQAQSSLLEVETTSDRIDASEALDLLHPDETTNDAEEKPALSALNIKGSATLGDALHKAFETFDFATAQLPWENFLLDEALSARFIHHLAAFFPPFWVHHYGGLAVFKQLFWHSLNQPILPNFTLALLPAHQKLHELSFTFNITAGTQLRLHDRLISVPTGFMTGFIDMIFIHNGRYYIVDWKTTTIGSCAADYAQEKLGEAMRHHQYDLQYYIYLVALWLYGKQLDPAFSYAQMGGVFYLFARGMVNPHTQGQGVFFNRPTQPELTAFAEQMGQKF